MKEAPEIDEEEKFSILSRIAKDIFAIQASTIASESALV